MVSITSHLSNYYIIKYISRQYELLNAHFVPFVMDPYGGLGAQALQFFDDIEKEAPIMQPKNPFKSSPILYSHLYHTLGKLTTP